MADLRAGIEALISQAEEENARVNAELAAALGVSDDDDGGKVWIDAADLRALLAAHPVQDECLDCGRTDGGCDRVVVPASAKVAPSYTKTGSSVEPLCERPPKGWVCTRLRGHTGPCASLPETI